MYIYIYFFSGYKDYDVARLPATYVRCGGAGHWVSVSSADVVLNAAVAGPAEQHDSPGAHQVAATGVALVRDVVQR